MGRREVLIPFSGAMLGLLLAALDQTIVATALPRIVADLHGLNHLSWVVTSYLVAATAATPLYGKFSDIHGRRITILVGISTFMVGSLACALAPSMLTLIVAPVVSVRFVVEPLLTNSEPPRLVAPESVAVLVPT